MSQVAGRSTEARTVASVVTTNSSTALTAPAGSFNEEDVNRPITGAGIPAGATLATAAAGGAAGTLSANATASATITATLGRNNSTDQGYGYFGWSPESDAESETYSIAGGASASAPDRLGNSTTRVDQRNR